ncbi:MAG: hypothetical protein ACYTBZ_26380 [Planctomycetota bacterium]|jgi:hypothetical protein
MTTDLIDPDNQPITNTTIMATCILDADTETFSQVVCNVWEGSDHVTNLLERHKTARDTLAGLLADLCAEYWPDGLEPPWETMLRHAWDQIDWQEVADKVLGVQIQEYRPLELPW